MIDTIKFLPEPGRWQPEWLTEGNRQRSYFLERGCPSTIIRMVPLPVPGRN